MTGSLNAGIAQWRGRVHVETDADGVIWIGGDTLTTISGTVGLGD